jgi:hypothetical protein
MNHTITLTDIQLKLLLKYLEDHEDALASECCNDPDKEITAWFTPKEGKKIESEFAYFNNPITPEGPSWPLDNYCLVLWLRKKIESQIKD